MRIRGLGERKRSCHVGNGGPLEGSVSVGSEVIAVVRRAAYIGGTLGALAALGWGLFVVFLLLIPHGLQEADYWDGFGGGWDGI